jgi:hypothetical protein
LSNIEENYDLLFEQVKKEFIAYRERARDFIPRMYDALKKEGLSSRDARDRIEKDCIQFWGKRAILDALPSEAKNQKMRRTPRAKNIAAVTAANGPANQRLLHLSNDATDASIQKADESDSVMTQYNNQITIPPELFGDIRERMFAAPKVAIVLTVRGLAAIGVGSLDVSDNTGQGSKGV